MRRSFIVLSLALCACVSAGCGASSPSKAGGRLSPLQGAREISKETLGEPHPGIKRLDVAPTFRGRVALFQMEGHFTAYDVCGGMDCPIFHWRHVVLAVNLRHPTTWLGLSGTSTVQMARIARARGASPRFTIFPEWPGGFTGVRCRIPGASGALIFGDCSTQDSQSRNGSRVRFTELWPHTGRLYHLRQHRAGWVVTFSRSGRITSVRATGHPPQLAN